MLAINVAITPELWDDEKEEFIPPKEETVLLEHSLLSVSKWETRWHKAFLTNKEKSFEESLDYIRCMIISENSVPDICMYLTDKNIKEIYEYMEEPMTAVYFREFSSGKRCRDTVTADLIYYWLLTLNIPFECESWHLNKLFALIRVCGIKNSPDKKRNKKEIMRHNIQLNEKRKKELDTTG